MGWDREGWVDFLQKKAKRTMLSIFEGRGGEGAREREEKSVPLSRHTPHSTLHRPHDKERKSQSVQPLVAVACEGK